MRRVVIAALLLIAGCDTDHPNKHEYLRYDGYFSCFAALDEKLTKRTDVAEQHLVDRLERIERNQYLIMVRLGVKP